MTSQQITLTGGSPWGFKMTGGRDFHQPLAIGKVKPNGKAHLSGVLEGFVIEKVNGNDFGNLTHHEAQNIIKSAGFTLTLCLSKPKPRADQPPAQPIINSAPPATKPSPAPQQFKAKGTHYQRYHNPGSWQNDGPIAQSPAMHAKVKSPTRVSESNGERPELTISPEIKQMIEEEEKERLNPPQPPPGSMTVGEVKTYNPELQHTNNHSVSPTPNHNKTKAASNIGKFIQGSNAPRYGEPTFLKTLQDINAILGDPAVLEVRLGNELPVPTVHWYHKNKPIHESKDKDIRFLSAGPVHTVVLGEVTNELLGSYSCTILNKNGSKSCRCTVSLDKSCVQQPKSPTSYYVPPSGPLSPGSESKRVLASTSMGLYSNQNVANTYQGQVNRRTSRDSNEESEVMKALREESPQKFHAKTPSMKFLEESLLPESEDL